MRRKSIQNDYWCRSRTVVFGILFIFPLWGLYEFLAYRLNGSLGGKIRTGLDYLVKSGFQYFHVPVWLALIIPVCLFVLFLIRDKYTLMEAKGHVSYFAFMLLESLVYAAFLGLLIGGLTGLFLNPSQMGVDQSRVGFLVINLGSGPYEELVFRLLLMTVIIRIAERLDCSQTMKYASAIIVSATAFAFFHYLDLFAEVFDIKSFLFRFLAGVTFSVMFIMRGYGIAACSHSLFNIFLMFRQS